MRTWRHENDTHLLVATGYVRKKYSNTHAISELVGYDILSVVSQGIVDRAEMITLEFCAS